MEWNWQAPDWPRFAYEADTFAPKEREFLLQSGAFIGAFRHIGLDDRDTLRIELLSEEALKTSEIEGEILNRESVQSSLRQQLGIGTDRRRIPKAEQGIARMMVDLYRNFSDPLTYETMFAWHRMVLEDGRLNIIGGYRIHKEPMQVVSGILHDPAVHFEAPPSDRVPAEMDAFINWFNDSAPDSKHPLPALTRAGIVHLYFVCIHPFEDGNGRIGRALAEKALAQNLGQPTLLALAYTIERNRKAYYAALERNNKDVKIDDWLTYFCETVLEAQNNTTRRVDFYLAKARLYERLRDQLNERQSRAIARMFREGIDGFKGGLSAENYITITNAARATATRDLQDLVAKGALTRTGTLRHTRYFLALED